MNRVSILIFALRPPSQFNMQHPPRCHQGPRATSLKTRPRTQSLAPPKLIMLIPNNPRQRPRLENALAPRKSPSALHLQRRSTSQQSTLWKIYVLQFTLSNPRPTSHPKILKTGWRRERRCPLPKRYSFKTANYHRRHKQAKKGESQ